MMLNIVIMRSLTSPVYISEYRSLRVNIYLAKGRKSALIAVGKKSLKKFFSIAKRVSIKDVTYGIPLV